MIELDARKLFCPMPVIKMQDEVAKHPVGTLIRICSSDPGALNDIPAWARIHGHKLIESETVEREYFVTVEVCEDK
ncbi:MAG: sulfurtransferase TusA family protein [Methylococcales bacterium]|jgi:tRNA 2-thiouridine synthesizing protein A|nr:sulfurtransferase TusA family protein [Methylococcales bacterium]MBT7445047.1 sulfurtransferase TusA family protein [Methylococcales bacterium]